MKSLRPSLYFQVIVAIVCGVVLGAVDPGLAAKMQPLGLGFIKLIKMLIAPVIFCTVVMGIAGVEDVKKVGRTGGLALLYFEVMSTVALVIGLAVANVVRPGSGMNVDPLTLDSGPLAAYMGPAKLQSVPDQDGIDHVVDPADDDAAPDGERQRLSPAAVKRQEERRRNPHDKGAQDRDHRQRAHHETPQQGRRGRPSHQNIRPPSEPWTAATVSVP